VSGTLREAPPEPPADLHEREPLELVLSAGEVLHRFFTADFEPLYFDRGPDGRLNSPTREYGVLYAAQASHGAFAETFLRVPGRTLLPSDFLARKAYVELEFKRPLTWVRLSGSGLARVGATAEVVHGGRPYGCPQRWSGALHSHPSQFDGIAYTARHDDAALCFAIFERAADALYERSRRTELDSDWFWDIAEPYGVGLAPDD
jgi:hypothetical protein